MPNLAPKIQSKKLKDNWFRICTNHDEDDVEKIPQETLDNDLLEAVRDNKTDETIAALEAGGNPVYEKDGWNPLLWSACNGNEEIVRVLIKRGACDPYTKDNDSSGEVKGDEEEDPLRDQTLTAS